MLEKYGADAADERAEAFASHRERAAAATKSPIVVVENRAAAQLQVVELPFFQSPVEDDDEG